MIFLSNQSWEFGKERDEYDRSRGRARGLVVQSLIDLVPGFFKTFRGLISSLFQLLLDFLSNVLFLDLLDHLSNPLFDLVAHLLGRVSDSFEYAGALCRFILGRHRRTGQDPERHTQPNNQSQGASESHDFPSHLVGSIPRKD